MAEPTTRLCIFCRCVEPILQPCPKLQNDPRLQSTQPVAIEPWRKATPLSADDEQLLVKLQQQPSSLCRRCSDYDIIGFFERAEPLDSSAPLTNDEFREYRQDMKRYQIPLGPLHSLLLVPACPFCRLIYRIMPRGTISPADTSLRIQPFRSYLRIPGWEVILPETKAQAAIHLGLDDGLSISQLLLPVTSEEEYIRPGEMTGEVIALASTASFPGRAGDNARIVDPVIDFSLVKQGLQLCEENHGRKCQAGKVPELSLIKVIDVHQRNVIPYPNGGCEYIALSYVWGGVQPKEGALASGSLPQTIEDAITVTQRLGKTFLWVDALCIDQRPNLTPEQAKNKQKQLKMMDLIYGCAYLTLVAMSGTDSNAGLPGVMPTHPRAKQLQETINGCVLFTVPPTLELERTSSQWSSRAWTMQEGILSRRYLYFTENQISYECSTMAFPESYDFGTALPAPAHSGQGLMNILRGTKDVASLPLTSPAAKSTFVRPLGGLMKTYTSRDMTNDSDSLNAILGILSAWQKRLLPSGFIWGLPLVAHPQFLGWMHSRDVEPSRRTDFPSWSWVGWSGEITIDSLLLEPVSERRMINPTGDLTAQYIGVNGAELTLQAWVVTMEVRAKPFSEAFVPGLDCMVGTIRERDFLHNNTISSGVYECLVVERVKYQVVSGGPEFQRVFMVILDWEQGVASRKTMVTLSTLANGDFMQLKPSRRSVRLK